MAISGDYSSPVTVNGFSCRNCSDVDRAKRHIDPENPAAGPFGINDSRKGGPAGRPANRYSAEARDVARLEARYRERQSAALSPVAAAYQGATAAPPARLVEWRA